MWFIIGLVICIGLLTLVLWLRRRKIKVTWYERLIGILGLLLLLFTIQNFIASFSEHEEFAAWNFLWILGLPAITLILVACILPWFRYRRVANKSSPDD